jgi:hypothetical protein
MRKSNLTYKQLTELAPKDRPFQIEVESNANNEGGKQILWANIWKYNLDTCLLKQNDIDNIEYDSLGSLWRNKYTGKFNLIDEYRNMYEKPEVLEEGTEVEILKSILDTLGENEDLPVGRISTIDKVVENNHGLKYRIETWYVPHYCVRPVEKVEEKEEEIITVNGKKYKLIEE